MSILIWDIETMDIKNEKSVFNACIIKKKRGKIIEYQRLKR